MGTNNQQPTTNNRIKIKAYAKVNLALEVLGKRDDSYHDIKTLLHNVDLYDMLTFEGAPSLEFKSNLSLKPSDNLVLKAANLLKSHADNKEGATINLDKNIPVRAGLGGGSADAAATLVALNEFWGLTVSKEKMMELGAQLGTDVNFFLSGGFGLAEGRGEQITSLDQYLGLDIVISKPNFGVSAKEAYEEWDRKDKSSQDSRETSFEEIIDGNIEKNTLFNDLEAPVLEKYPELKKVISDGYAAGAKKVMLCGSGSAVFAVVDRDRIKAVFEAWKQNNLDVYKTKTISRGVEIN